MDTFLKNNHVVIMTVAITNLLLCLMPPYNHQMPKQPHFIDENEDSIQESTGQKGAKFQTEEEVEIVSKEIISNEIISQEEISQEEILDDIFFRIYDDFKK